MKSGWVLFGCFVYILFGTLGSMRYFRVQAQDKAPVMLPAPAPPTNVQAEPKPPAGVVPDAIIPREELEKPGPLAMPKTFEPTEVELLRLQVLEKDAELSQIALAQASANWQKATSNFNAQVETIKKAHGWPADVHLDAVTYGKTKELKFVEAVPLPERKIPRAPAAEKKP